MKYLGIEPARPKVAVFDFTGCEGCELQLANKEESLAAFLGSIEIVNFREVTSTRRDDYDVAIIDGCISRDDEVERIKEIRSRAKILVAMGSCASFGGVNRMKNAYNLDDANREVYGDKPQATGLTRSIKEVVDVDLEIPGCPVSKEEVERIVQHLVLGVAFTFPVSPVCFDCKHRFITCLFEHGKLCLGSIARSGCNAPCPAGGLGCWGCRGPAEDCNLEQFIAIARERGFSQKEIDERLGFFGGFEGLR
ncbi:MAG: NADH:ubiquinone oxidoreductase [Deltaproteobacteria bacterium RIFOXYA12_FULL_58_15]|nr:MAG: NADH:ubiquinone oxidoreductase [Deltaproteobacteria bacterium RIFOXYA12_FULL_58_15]OGR14350.1 MAG: NADH:ubiquinone oxidoreductase [Deltaproteobacteria bacterium RIFOXYB12_FULL_58_9]